MLRYPTSNDMSYRAVVLILQLATLPAWAEPLRIVLDPGHGGSNLGASGSVPGTLEKEVTLDLARQVREEILDLRPSAEVRLTRDDDRLVTLSRRAEVANEWAAAAFVSLHLNASPDRRQRGFESYVHGPGPPVEPGEHGERAERGAEVADILADLRRKATGAESAHLAALVQRHLGDALGPAADRGVKRAPFDVLSDARVPSVLVEVGFIDHPEEGAEMLKPDVQRSVARALALALLEFCDRREARRLIFAAHP
jgi:N-acetylmuramoyl-L-alanine amidase